ncbi:mucin-6-like [Anopheles darlingi]|uniref:mucin-6-like n=1 Tax=Anopheles darlingi TaxID=43151 RepID=UPI0020FFFA24|nr:mucin-6-like [Anopheles darlingi]
MPRCLTDRWGGGGGGGVAVKVALAVALLCCAAGTTVLASRPESGPTKTAKVTADSVAAVSGPTAKQSVVVVSATAPNSSTKKTSSHGKREVASYGYGAHFPQHSRYSFGAHSGHPLSSSELYAPATGHGAYSYSIPQHSSFPVHGSFGGHKLFASPASLKYSQPGGSSHAFFSPIVHHHHQPQTHSFSGGFSEPIGHPIKYGSSFGTNDLTDILKKLQTVGPLTIKAIPSSFAYGSFGDHHEPHHASPLLFDSNSLHSLKPTAFKVQEFPSFHSGLPQAAALTAPGPGPTSTSSTYGHLSHSLGYEPSYASGVKGLRHYSTPNVPERDLYSGNKYISSISLQQPSSATMVSPLHTSVHSTFSTQKPFKPSTYLGSSHETISAPSNSHAQTHPIPTGSYLAPSLQYLPAVSSKQPHHTHKLSYDSPAKHGYLPPAPPTTNAYLPPLSHSKPSTNAYLPPVSGAGQSNYIPLHTSAGSSSTGSHEDTVLLRTLSSVAEYTRAVNGGQAVLKGDQARK